MSMAMYSTYVKSMYSTQVMSMAMPMYTTAGYIKEEKTGGKSGSI